MITKRQVYDWIATIEDCGGNETDARALLQHGFITQDELDSFSCLDDSGKHVWLATILYNVFTNMSA